MNKLKKAGLTLGLVFYLLVLAKLILFKHLSPAEIVDRFAFREGGPHWLGHNFIPFQTIAHDLFLADELPFNIRLENLAGNVLGFVPFGWMLPLLSSKFRDLKKIAVATFG